ncbi:25858_t:CDS:2 [Gigaspora margarita]|uniref:25858_t:CDS:1 n=1 Tax=Gigaspora margarita TaxID=4874 RepID=A0ABN7UQ74_GIGMA|nr:25858_t:CDS:2 [Gigaspora margarita]
MKDSIFKLLLIDLKIKYMQESFDSYNSIAKQKNVYPNNLISPQ